MIGAEGELFPGFFASCSKSAVLHMQLLENQVLRFVTVPPSLSWLPVPHLTCPTAARAEGTPVTPLSLSPRRRGYPKTCSNPPSAARWVQPPGLWDKGVHVQLPTHTPNQQQHCCGAVLLDLGRGGGGGCQSS